MVNISEGFIKQLREVVEEYDSCFAKSEYEDASDVLKHGDVFRIRTRAIAMIERVTGKGSEYYEQAMQATGDAKYYTPHQILQLIIGILKALVSDIESGYMKSLTDIVHAELFSDYLEMAQHLIEKGFKDAAAVIAGSTLEAHMKQLAGKFGIDVEDGNGRSKSANTINAELKKAGAYNKLDEKNVTAWLDLRNKAAHGDYESYSDEEVRLLLENIRSFITRNPA